MENKYIEYSEKGLIVKSKEITLDQWGSAFGQMVIARDRLKWYIGDMALYGLEHYGEKAWQYLQNEYFEDIRQLKNAVYVCRAVPPERRIMSLSFSHHRYVAPFEAEDQMKLLAEAKNDGLTCDELKNLIKRREGKDDIISKFQKWFLSKYPKSKIDDIDYNEKIFTIRDLIDAYERR